MNKDSVCLKAPVDWGKVLTVFTLLGVAILIAVFAVDRQSRDLVHKTLDANPAPETVPASAEIAVQGEGYAADPVPDSLEPTDDSVEAAWEARFRTVPRQPLAEDRRVGDYTISEHRVFKEQYYCELAVQAREQCQAAADDDSYRRCLSLRSYHTYSRHCGYQP